MESIQKRERGESGDGGGGEEGNKINVQQKCTADSAASAAFSRG